MSSSKQQLELGPEFAGKERSNRAFLAKFFAEAYTRGKEAGERAAEARFREELEVLRAAAGRVASEDESG